MPAVKIVLITMQRASSEGVGKLSVLIGEHADRQHLVFDYCASNWAALADANKDHWRIGVKRAKRAHGKSKPASRAICSCHGHAGNDMAHRLNERRAPLDCFLIDCGYDVYHRVT